MATTFSFVTFAWVFFRAKDMVEALNYIERICVSIINNPKQFFSLPGGKLAIVYIIPLLVGDWWFRKNERGLFYNFENNCLRIILYFLIFNAILIFNKFFENGNTPDFIYFQF